MQKSARLSTKLGIAAASALALTFGAVAPAFAADVQLGPGDVVNYQQPNEADPNWNYNQWHIGSNDDAQFPLESSVTFQECSITTLAHQRPGSHVQVLKGFDIAARPTALGNGNIDAIRALVESTSITVLQGNVTIQLPMFEMQGTNVNRFTTVRSVLLGPGTYNLASLQLEDSRGWFGTSLTVADFYSGMEMSLASGLGYQSLGVGFTGSENAVVQSLSFAGNTYFFGTGNCAPAIVAPTPPSSVQTAAK